MSPTKLRPYQERTVRRARASYRAGHRRIAIVSPTGSGKTRMGVELVLNHLGRVVGARVLWVAHRTELVQQARERLLREGADRVGIIAASIENPDPDAAIQVASVQTLLARDDRPEATMVIADEAHHYVADQWREALDEYDGAVVLGLTATPERGDGRPLGDMFEDLVVGAQPRELVELGHLVDVEVVAPDRELGRDDLASHPLEAYEGHGDGGLAFAFARTVAEGENFAADFNAVGIASRVIHGGTPADEREDTLEAFKAGHVRVLWNVFVLTEGVDVPEASVCILARGTGACGTYLQMAGRVLRPFPGKEKAVILDLSGATLKHGSPLDDRVFSLEGRRGIGAAPSWFQAGNGGGGAQPPMRIVGAPLRGANMADRALVYFDLCDQAASRGYKLGWAAHKYKSRFGQWPPRSWKRSWVPTREVA